MAKELKGVINGLSKWRQCLKSICYYHGFCGISVWSGLWELRWDSIQPYGKNPVCRTKFYRGDSIITSRPGERWVYTFFVTLRDGKLGGGWYLINVRDVTVKKFSMKYFCIIKEKISYMECIIQSSMFYSSYLFLSTLLCNIVSALVSDSNTYAVEPL